MLIDERMDLVLTTLEKLQRQVNDQMAPSNLDGRNAQNYDVDHMELGRMHADEDGEITDHDVSDLSSEDDIFDAIDRRYNNNNLQGPPVRERFVSMTEKAQFKKMDDAKFDEAMNRALTPQNIDFTVPSVNGEIWQNLNPKVRSFDAELQKNQNNLNRINGNIIKGTDELINYRARTRYLEHKQNFQNEIERNMDNIKLIMHTNIDIAMRRREAICNTFKIQKYRKLASEKVPLTTELFGNNLKESLGSIDAAEKVGHALSRSHRYQPYGAYDRKPSHHPRRKGNVGTWYNQRPMKSSKGRRPLKKPSATISRPDDRQDPPAGESIFMPVSESNEFVAGRLSSCLDVWQEITSDRFILDLVCGLKIKFDYEPVQLNMTSVNEVEWCLIDKEISKLLHLKQHFKMDSIQTVLGMMKKNCYMAKIDLKSAY